MKIIFTPKSLIIFLIFISCSAFAQDINDLTLSSNSCDKVTLSWSDVSGETAYRVRRKLSSESVFTNITDVNANVTSYTDNTVNGGTSYTYQVRPVVDGTPVGISNQPEISVQSCSSGGGGGGDCAAWFNNNGLWKGKGRIAISSDGNEHDHDDWAATPLSLALLAAKGLQDKLVLYTFSDHVWGSNHDHSDARQQMRISALEGKTQFGFDKTNFIEAVANPNAAYSAMTAEINKSTADDPLFIVAAGPMQVVGKAINDAQESKLKYVTILSHSRWNDRHSDNPNNWENHSGWTWDEIENTFKSKGLNVVHITDQNGGTGYDGLRAARSKFDWIKNSSARNNPIYKAGSWDWLYARQETVIKGGEFDPSDAGMIVYLLTGIEKTEPSDAKNIMESPVAKCSGDNTGGGGTGDCENSLTLSAISDFPTTNVNGFAPAYKDNNNQCLAINAAQYKDQFAAAKTTFSGSSGTYDVTITTLTELDGESTYRLKINGNLVGTYKNPTTNTDYKVSTHTWKDVKVNNGDAVQVEFNSHTNGKIPEGETTAYSRGRWTQLSFDCPDGNSTGGGDTGGGTCDGYEEENGVVMMEAENTKSNLGKWVLKTDNPGYSGTGHLEFTGNSINGGPATSPLEYTFKINTAGYYRLHMRVRKRLDGAEPDKCNDGYVKLAGDFDQGPNAGNNHNDDAPESMLRSNTKFFGGPANGWGWASKLDAGGHDNKRDPIYYLKAGETYTLTLSGRSIRWNVDRIAFIKTDGNESAGKNLTTETGCKGGNTGGGGDDCSFNVSVSKKDATCNTAGSVTLSLSDYGTRTNVRYKVGNAAYSDNVGTSETYMVDNLSAGTYDIYAEWGNGDCANTMAGSFTIAEDCTPQEPGDVTGLTATATACGEIELSWNDVDHETGYRIRRKLASENTYVNIGDVNAGVTSFTDMDVDKNTDYVYMVRPLVDGTAIALSNLAEVTSDPCVVTSVFDNQETTFRVYPNPATDKVQLSESTKWKLYNAQGQFIKEGEGDVIRVSELPQGIYLLEMGNSRTKIFKK